MSDILNLCLIGTGRAGMIHARNFRSAIRGARLIALCDPSEENLKLAQDELGCEYTYSDYKDALQNDKIDAVVIVTPTIFHRDIAVAAAKAGKHILCEKPMAVTEAECDEMIAAARENNVKLQVGFMRRFDASFRAAKDIADAGEIGDIVMIKSLTRGPSNPKPWMFDISVSTGPIGEVNSHDFDTLRWYAGSEAKSIYTLGGNFRSPEVREQYPDYYDTVSMNISFQNGCIGAIDGAQYVQYGYDARAEIVGTKGCILVGDQHKHSVVAATADGKLTRSVMHSWTYLFREAYVEEDQSFVDCILKDSEPEVTGHDGKMALCLVKAGLASLLEKRVVQL